ncbi:uncharacterized protein ACJ7VT_020994 isoform 2-T2 [Polymixia lowei]
MVSFKSHQKIHEEQASKKRTQPELKCPDIGMSFARLGLLMAHLKVHRPSAPLQSKLLRCNRCSKTFNSLQTLLAHCDLHKRKPFWCLSCAKGFRDKKSLDRHLHGHNLRRHTCNICSKSFRVPAELRYHYNTHTGAKPFRCTLCKKSFSQLGNLITHRKKHVGVYVGFSKTPLGTKNPSYSQKRRVAKMKQMIFTGVGNEVEMVTSMKDLEGEEKREYLRKHFEIKDYTSDKSNCDEESKYEEPVPGECYFKLSELPTSSMSGSSVSYSPDACESEEELQRRQRQDKNESQETNFIYRELNKYWEWECFECDLGFDEEAELHLHYMKHASGELPILQDDI